MCVSLEKKSINKALILECDELILKKNAKIDVSGFGREPTLEGFATTAMQQLRGKYFDCPSFGLLSCNGSRGGGIIHLMVHVHFENQGKIVANGLFDGSQNCDSNDGGYVLVQTPNRQVIKNRGIMRAEGGWHPQQGCIGHSGIVHVETQFHTEHPTQYLVFNAKFMIFE